MAGITLNVQGGGNLEKYLAKIAASINSVSVVRVGFLEDALYPDGTSVATVAAVQEFGATIKQPPRKVTIYRRTNKAGTGFLNGGRFVPKKRANFASEHQSAGGVVRIPSRPFFRNAIAKHKGEWGGDLVVLLKATNMDVAKSLKGMGALIQAQIQLSINNTNTPPNAPSTIARKGAAKPLIDTRYMWRRVAYEVKTAG